MTLCTTPAVYLESEQDLSVCPLHIVATDAYDVWRDKQSDMVKSWLAATRFDGKPGDIAICPAPDGALASILVIQPEQELLGARDWATVVAALPSGDYRLMSELTPQRLHWFCVGWFLGQYSFDRYRSQTTTVGYKRLVWPASVNRDAVQRQVTATCLVRDLVNTPAEDMGPADLAAVATEIAETFGAKSSVIIGDDLKHCGYPAVHAVGRAADKLPHMIDLQWGNEDAPRLTLVGKGVCFDTGGLNLKPGGSMKLMKKDMGGAAHALAMAYMIMDAGLPVRLRVLIPAVENAVSGNAFRPQDIIQTRRGLSVEIGNTDAEGRVILADALTAAGEDAPELIIDFATLTGAARSALGPDIPAMFTGDNSLAHDLLTQAEAHGDPLWQLPLWQPYTSLFRSKIADVANASESPFAGSITAALFLSRFVPNPAQWVHFDMYAWNASGRPGTPEGGEAQTLQAVFAVLSRRFST